MGRVYHYPKNLKNALFENILSKIYDIKKKFEVIEVKSIIGMLEV